MATEALLVSLPGDRLYPEECRIQTFTYGDASTLSLLPKTQDTTKLFEVIGRRLSIDVKMLTLQDFWFILYWQRINSYSSFPVKLPWTCPHCKTKNIDELTGSKLIINDLDPDYTHGMEVEFPDLGVLKFRLKLVGDELLIKKYLRENDLTDSTPELFDELLTACMLDLNGGSLEERLHLVQNMSAQDQFILKALENEFDYGVKNYADFTCENDKCKEVVKVNYQFDLASFFPSFQDKSDVRSRVLLRKTAKPADREPSRHGSNEIDLYQGSPCEELKGTSGQTESSPISNELQEKKIEMTASELHRLIQEGIAKSQGKGEEFIDFNTITD